MEMNVATKTDKMLSRKEGGVGTVIFAVGLGPAIEAAYWVLMRLGITRPEASMTPAVSPAISST